MSYLHKRDNAPRSVQPQGVTGRFMLRAIGSLAAMALPGGQAANPEFMSPEQMKEMLSPTRQMLSNYGNL